MATNRPIIHVVSHDDAILDQLPDADYLSKENLNTLGLSREFSGNELAENRFLLTTRLVEGEGELVGFISARWDERFPNWPKVGELDSIFEKLPMDGKSYFNPQSVALSNNQFIEWIKAEDAVHPGISKLLFELVDLVCPDGLGTNSIRMVSMGNNFIMPREIAEDFLKYWQSTFNYFQNKYGLDLPFSYRCPMCGKSDENGVGRWGRGRHAGFFYERVSALYFATSPGLKAFSFTSKGVKPYKRTFRAFILPLGPFAVRFKSSLMRGRKTCTHVIN